MSASRQPSKVEKTSISPMLSVRKGVKAIEFYKRAFGAEESVSRRE